jgi:hypothetical protein
MEAPIHGAKIGRKKRAAKVDAAKIARTNRGVDLRQLRDLGSVLKALRSQGIERSGYNVALPFTRQPIRTGSRTRLRARRP